MTWFCPWKGHQQWRFKTLSYYQTDYSLIWLTLNFKGKSPTPIIWILTLPLPSCSFWEKDQQTLNRTSAIGQQKISKGNPFSSTKAKVIFWKTMIYGKRSSHNTMTFYPPDTLGKSKPLMLLKSIIGGLECGHSSRIMSKDVAYVTIQDQPESISTIVQPNTWPNIDQTFCEFIHGTNLPSVTLDNGTVVDAILSIVDHGLTKGVILTPCLKNLTEEGAGEILLHHVYKWFGLSNSIISDWDPRFTAKSFQELLKLLGIKLKLMTAYWPQSDGMTECFNQEIEAYIRIYCSSNPETWHKSISTMEFTHNSWRHSDWQRTSFELMIGTPPLTVPTTFKHTKFPSVEKWIQQLMKDWKEAIATHELAWWCMAKRHKNKFSGFKLDQLVWLDTWNLKTKYHKKMAPKHKGPFKSPKSSDQLLIG